MLTLWRNASIATCDDAGRVFERGAIVTDDARIAWVGDERDLPVGLGMHRTIELAGRWITPGLVDCHTHLVFAGQRAAEFARRTAGTSYAEIAREGGGILSTVRATRAASLDDLVAQGEPRVRSLLQEGVTTLEIKSGYGLDYGTERRMLLAAHAVPPEYAGRPDEYVTAIVDEWLPRFAREAAGGRPLVDMVDAYCESIAFSAAQCDRLFAAAKSHGWPVRLHAEQISNIGGSQLAAKHRALACDHLEYATEADAIELARAGTVAVLLPVAYYVLGDPHLPPLEHLRAHGVPLAVASDANPGSAPGASLLVAMNMARRLFGMSSDEVLHGVTRHAARALGLHGRCGVLAPGLDADFAVWSIGTLDELGYWIGYNPCSMVVRGGAIVLERDA